ncbi:MAG: hypothetical protein IH586_15455 [Anaerolineaceae bacterium]|nr:hypothetical protein [Anaerolineaceae bacterium]
MANYSEDHPNPEKGLVPGSYPAKKILDRLADLGFHPVGYEDGNDSIKGRKVRIAILDNTGISRSLSPGGGG